MNRRSISALLTCMIVVTASFAEEVTMEGIIDDGYEIYINGTRKDVPPGKKVKAELNEGDVLGVKVWDAQGGERGGFAMRITRADGSKMDTDGKWRFGKDLVENWNQKDFDDSTWKKARIVKRDWIAKTVKAQFFKGSKKPKIIWGKGGTVYFRRHINFAEFK